MGRVATVGRVRSRRTKHVLLGSLLVSAVLLAACSGGSGSSTTPTTVSARDRTYPPKVALFGDSLAWEAEPYYTGMVNVTGATALAYNSHGGTAICDWLAKMQEVATKHQPTAAQLGFSGNALTPCMKGYVYGTDEYYAKYRADTEAAIAIFVPVGTHVYLVGAPVNRGQAESNPQWDRLNQQYAAIAAANPTHVTYIPAGTAVEGPDHTFAETLPCLAVEPCTGPVVEGAPSNTVRAPDGAHFCPVLEGDDDGVIGGCPVYSSGAFRYAYAMFVPMGVSPNTTGDDTP